MPQRVWLVSSLKEAGPPYSFKLSGEWKEVSEAWLACRYLWHSYTASRGTGREPGIVATQGKVYRSCRRARVPAPGWHHCQQEPVAVQQHGARDTLHGPDLQLTIPPWWGMTMPRPCSDITLKSPTRLPNSQQLCHNPHLSHSSTHWPWTWAQV